MRNIPVVVVGAGQAGLAVSYLLTLAGVDHAVLERGRIAERWRSQRWESLRLLTPNWMNRLPGRPAAGPDPDGYLAAACVAELLSDYAKSFEAPVSEGVDVTSVRRVGAQYRVITNDNAWTASSVVVATGYSALPAVPSLANRLPSTVAQLTPDRYRRPSDTPDGTVLIVGASATGVQLADELVTAGRDVVLAAGRHTRLPRRYRGMDVMWWLDVMGVLDEPYNSARAAHRQEPSLQLTGSHHDRDVDLPALIDRGVRPAGRLLGVDGRTVTLADDLGSTTAAADTRLEHLLERIDRFAVAAGLDAEVEPHVRPRRSSSSLPTAGPNRLRLGGRGIRSVIWATGYHRRYPWLHVPVLDATGEIVHRAGETAAPGLFVVGMRWQTRRNSAFLGGVGNDAQLVVERLLSGILDIRVTGRWAA